MLGFAGGWSPAVPGQAVCSGRQRERAVGTAGGGERPHRRAGEERRPAARGRHPRGSTVTLVVVDLCCFYIKPECWTAPEPISLSG